MLHITSLSHFAQCLYGALYKHILLLFFLLVAIVALLFRFPSNKKTYQLDRQFMWGSSLLIAPVLMEVFYIYTYIINIYHNYAFMMMIWWLEVGCLLGSVSLQAFSSIWNYSVCVNMISNCCVTMHATVFLHFIFFIVYHLCHSEYYSICIIFPYKDLQFSVQDLVAIMTFQNNCCCQYLSMYLL